MSNLWLLKPSRPLNSIELAREQQERFGGKCRELPDQQQCGKGRWGFTPTFSPKGHHYSKVKQGFLDYFMDCKDLQTSQALTSPRQQSPTAILFCTPCILISLLLGLNISLVSWSTCIKQRSQMRSEVRSGVEEGQTWLMRGQATRLVTISLRLLLRGPLALRESVRELCMLEITWLSSLQPGFSMPASSQIRQRDSLSQGMLRLECSRRALKARQQLQISTMELEMPSEGKRILLTMTFFLRYSSPTILPSTLWKTPEAPPSMDTFTITPWRLSHPSIVFCKTSSTCSVSYLPEISYPREQSPPLPDLLHTILFFLQYSLFEPVRSSAVEYGSQSIDIALQLKVLFCDSSKKTGLYLASMRDEVVAGESNEC